MGVPPTALKARTEELTPPGMTRPARSKAARLRCLLMRVRSRRAPNPRLVKFLHAADLHIDSPLRGLERLDAAPAEAIRRAPRDAVGGFLPLALEEKVGF